MWYGREVVGVEVGEVNDSGADMDIFRLLAVYVCLLANIRVIYHIIKQKSKKTAQKSPILHTVSLMLENYHPLHLIKFA